MFNVDRPLKCTCPSLKEKCGKEVKISRYASVEDGKYL